MDMHLGIGKGMTNNLDVNTSEGMKKSALNFSVLYRDSAGSSIFREVAIIRMNATEGNVVKHTLKSKILERRNTLGLGNVTVDFSTKPSYPMTKEEIEKDRRRKQSNRDSAQRCRQKQKIENERNKKLLARLKEDHEKLAKEVGEMEVEKNRILFALKTILPDSYILEALKRIDHPAKNGNASRYDTTNSGPTDALGLSDVTHDEIRDDNLAFVTNGLILNENCGLEDDFSASENWFSSLITSSEVERPVVERDICGMQLENEYSTLQQLLLL